MALSLPKISRRKKRIGRGIGARGAKSGRGQKGQKSRAGYTRKFGHEGGQTPLYMRLPKGRGTKQWPASLRVKSLALEVSRLPHVAQDGIVGPGSLRKAGVLKRKTHRIKLIGSDKVAAKYTVRVHAASPAAVKAVEDAGGKVEIIK
ncbi:MAG: 50S ribosomal protein L15 [Candidatus Andersenbacteria bacterium]|nr:50S ribosomal protein L15 [Candidatus Andersenbacteria bacterium]MBI3251058.1 50S ribosomal protein L15 [Candidatus Andersenbacteria bacterium]